MGLIEAIVLGIVQGLTEFLPISSTAHLRIVPALAGWDDPGAAFSAVIQCGTLAAVLAYFRRDIVQMSRAWLAETIRGQFAVSLEGRLAWMIIFGTVPIVVCGVLFKDEIETTLRSLYVIAGALIGLALLLWLAEFYTHARQRAGKAPRTLAELSWLDAVLLGLAQTVSLIPGSSRSGVTITAGLFAGMSREAAARFSFLLSLPAVLAAGVFELYKERGELLASQAHTINLIAATLASAVVGYATIAFLLAYLRTHSTYVFILYRLAMGVFLLVMLASGRLSPLEGVAERAARVVSTESLGTVPADEGPGGR